MKREIYNPFEASAKTEETMVSESLSIDSEGICPKCGGTTNPARIGGFAGVAESSVMYCTNCRVTLPMADK
jgi:hypothetical protein